MAKHPPLPGKPDSPGSDRAFKPIAPGLAAEMQRDYESSGVPTRLVNRAMPSRKIDAYDGPATRDMTVQRRDEIRRFGASVRSPQSRREPSGRRR